MPVHPLRVWLLENQMRQEQFAARVGVKQGYLSLIITGVRRPSRALARAISKATKRSISMEQLLTFEIPAGVKQPPRRARKPSDERVPAVETVH